MFLIPIFLSCLVQIVTSQFGYFNTTRQQNGGIICTSYFWCAKSTLRTEKNSVQRGTAATYGSFMEAGNYSGADGTYMYGYASGAFGDMINHGNRLQCIGGMACFGASKLISTFKKTPYRWYCRGLSSCAQIENISNPQAEAHFEGTFDLFNSTVYSNGIGETDMHFWGYYSGYNATVICNNNDVCNIECANYGCYNLNIICQNGSTCNINNYDASGIGFDSIVKDINDNIYPIIPYYEKYYVNKEFVNNVLFYNQLDNVCEIQCTAEGDCTNVNLNSTNTGNICCYGYNACNNSNIVFINNTDGDYTYTYVDYMDMNILCNGQDSCNFSSITTNGNIHVAGGWAFQNGNINNGEVENMTFNLLTCESQETCSSTTIKNGKIMICSGQQSCSASTIENVDIIYALGYFSLRSSTIVIGTNQTQIDVYLLASIQQAYIDCRDNPNANVIIYTHSQTLAQTVIDKADSCDNMYITLLNITDGIDYDYQFQRVEDCDNAFECFNVNFTFFSWDDDMVCKFW